MHTFSKSMPVTGDVLSEMDIEGAVLDVRNIAGASW